MISIARFIKTGAICGLACVLMACGSGLSGSALATTAAPAVSLSATSLSPGWFPVGTTSEAINLFVTNSGTATLWITGVTLTGPNPGDFALNNGCASSLAAGANCLITFTFTPTAPGTRTAYINVNDNAPGTTGWGTQTVTIYGTGEGATATLSKSSLTFASQATGTASAAQTLTLSNAGNENLSLSSIGLAGANPGDFAQSNNCGSSVAAGGTCTISVTFKPAAAGTLTAALALADNVPGSPQSVGLSGSGAGASTGTTVSLSSSSLAFGNVATDTASSSQTVTLSNTGSAALTITDLAFTGTNAGDFTQNDTCNSSVAAGASCTIVIVFKPSASGSATASLQIADSATGSPQAVTLSGTGTHDVTLAWSAVTSTSVAGYNVFRGTSSGGESSTPLNSTPVEGTSYTDASVSAGVTYYYVLTSVAAGGTTQSAKSNEVSAVVP
jgi:hypothetical protein